MTTNESFFFRDTTPFKLFEDSVLPDLLKSRAQKRQIRIWSAACSSGQEPYTLAMILKEHASELDKWRVEILATDLSTQILQKAKEGNYSQFEVQRGLPITLLMKYFTQVGDKWQIADELRQMVTYRVFNLLDSMSALGQFDVVYCRNVLIYFDQETKAKVAERYRRYYGARRCAVPGRCGDRIGNLRSVPIDRRQARPLWAYQRKRQYGGLGQFLHSILKRRRRTLLDRFLHRGSSRLAQSRTRPGGWCSRHPIGRHSIFDRPQASCRSLNRASNALLQRKKKLPKRGVPFFARL